MSSLILYGVGTVLVGAAVAAYRRKSGESSEPSEVITCQSESAVYGDTPPEIPKRSYAEVARSDKSINTNTTEK